MAINNLSPGVNVKEVDLTNFVPSVGTSGGAFVGSFHWGPVLEYTVVSDSNRLAAVFGKPSDSNYVDWYSVSNFLGYTNNCNVIRVVHTVSGVSTAFNAISKTVSSANSGVTINNDADFASNFGVSSTYNAKNFAAKYPGKLGNSLKVVVVDSATWAGFDAAYKKLFDGAPDTSAYTEALGGTGDEVHVVVVDRGGLFTGTPGAVLEKFAYLSKASDAKGLDGAPVFYGSVINKTSKYIRYLGSDYDTSILVYGHTVNTATVDVAVNGTGYVIGDVVTFSAPTGGGTVATGTVSAVDLSGEISAVTVTVHGTGYDTAQTVIATSITSTAGTGADLSKIVGVLSTTATSAWGLPVLDTTTGAPSNYGLLTAAFSKNFEGGADGGALDAGDLQAGWDMFKQAEEVDVSILFSGAAGGDTVSTAVNNYIIGNIAESRKDCMLFFSPLQSDVVDQSQETATTNIITTRNAINYSSSYAAMDSGWKLQYDVYNDKQRWIPLNADIAGLCAQTDLNFDAWWSPAGFTRGKIKNVIALAFNPNKTQRDELSKNNVNSVVNFKGDGVVLYGDKTLQAKSSAFQFINVRRLFIVLEKAISKASQYQLFEFNDEFTRAQFVNMVEPYLREVKGRRGLYDFKVICDETNNTPEVVDAAEFVASIFLKPARSINFITLNFVAVRTGVSFTEIAGG